MQITFDDTTIEIPDGLDPDAILETVRENPDFVKAVEERASGLGYERFSRWDELGEDTAKTIAQALFDSGPDAAETAIDELCSGIENSPEEYFDAMFDSDNGLRGLRDAVVQAALEADEDLDEDDFGREVRSAMRELAAEAMVAADTSKPLDVIPSHAVVEVYKIFGVDGPADDVDQVSVQNVSPVFRVGTVIPGQGLQAFFEAANLSFGDFAAHVAETDGVDLRAGPGDEALVAWLTAADYWGDRGAARERALQRAGQWRDFRPGHAPDKPSVITAEDMYTVIENAGGYSFPMFVSRPRLKELLAHDWTRGLEFGPDTSLGGRSFSGGFVGLFDSLNGSGYVTEARAPVTVAPGLDGWKVSGRHGSSVDDVFGIVGTAYRVGTKALPAPEPEPEVAPGM